MNIVTKIKQFQKKHASQKRKLFQVKLNCKQSEQIYPVGLLLNDLTILTIIHHSVYL